MEEEYDVIITGGSFAGLSAAMALGRALRRVLIIDSGRPCNEQTPYSHNFITQDGQKPAAIKKKALEQVLAYPTVSLLEDKVTDAGGENRRFHVKTESEKVFRAKKLLFATGIQDTTPDIPGFADCWGISVIHCPYCHGYEVAGKKTGILAIGKGLVELTQLIRNWSKDLVVFTNGTSDFDAKLLSSLAGEVIEQKVLALEQISGNLNALRLQDGSRYPLEVMYARPAFRQHCVIPEKSGCSLDERGFIQVDQINRTDVPGIFAAGDCAGSHRAVSAATAEGGKAGASINNELIHEESLAAVS